MNKKLVALALILLLAVGGLFAEHTIAKPGDVTAYLKANIGEFLEHGFTVDSVMYQPSITINDAFNTNPEFEYGYRTNAQGTINFLMTVGDFLHTNGNARIVIKEVQKGGVKMTPAVGTYVLFDEIVNATSKETENVKKATFKIVPAKKGDLGQTDHTGSKMIGTVAPVGENAGYVNYADVADSTPGSYTSTVTIAISIV